jgi:purine-binding chemotaxis protein CheW
MIKARSDKRAIRRADGSSKRVEYLAFGLAGEFYAVPIAQIAEILREPPLTGVPRAPRDVLGVISVRGKLITVVDLRRRFRLPETPLDQKARILLSDAGLGEQLGLLVDEVREVWRLAPDEIEPATVLGDEQPAHIAGIGRPKGSAGTALILLDLGPVLALS